ncbi:hypothetical protein OSB04_002649 [Centaurea solstitialis]|uniref:Uncharacterized protein n=1 Tax=Centaurea solstitialis TaxID=347529 RepID=A0AA38TTA1_9ASTR|nr:hypothetical protein OSB04_002649 [Centaurea solstitialis]
MYESAEEARVSLNKSLKEKITKLEKVLKEKDDELRGMRNEKTNALSIKASANAACGPIAKQSLGEKKYILVLIDEFSRYTWVEFVKKKSHVPMLLINLLKRLQVFHGIQIRVIRNYLASVGITHNFSASRTPQQNVVVERKNKTSVEAARTMLNASSLPLSF